MKNNVAFLLLSVCLFITACSKKGDQLKKPVQQTEGTVNPVITNPPDETQYHHDGEVNKLYNNTPNGVNIVILGDGFIKDDLKKNGVFDTEVKKVVDYLFTVQPFKQYKQYFNTYVVYAESRTRGAGSSSGSSDTKFGSFFGSTTNRSLMTNNYSTCYDYAARAIPRANTHLIVLLVNESKYGGTGGSIAVLSTHELSRYIMVHEVGHTFAGLGDEYVEEVIADNYPLSRLPYMANIDATDDPTKTKWSHFVGLSSYSGVKSYEGAYYRTKGMFRPESTSLMQSLSSLNFNAPSREAIVKRICGIVGIPYNFNDFLRDDASARTTVSIKLNGEYSLPKNDFINMDERLKELALEAKTFEH